MRRNTRFALVLLMLAAVFVLAACGGGDEEEEPTDEVVPAETTDEDADAQDVEETPEVEVEETEEATEEAGMEAMGDEEETPEAEMTEEADMDAMAEGTPEAEMEATEEAVMDEEMDEDVVETAEAGDFTTLVAAIEAAELTEALQGPGPFTVFAPTDDAFAAALDALGLTAEELLADTETLTTILTYHVVEGGVFAEDVIALDGETATTLQGEDISIAVEDGAVVLNGSVNVTQVDVAASNGVIHVIDGVLLPPSMSGEEADMGDMEATEEADMDMEETPEAEMTEEPEMEATEEAAMEDEEDMASEEEGMEEEVELMSIIDTAYGDPNFSSLRAAITAADLEEALSGEGPFTVFAPTNDAFSAAVDALGITFGELLADEETLTTVLLYHVVEGEVTAEQVMGMDGESVATLGGEELTISVSDDGVMLNESVNVVTTDVMATNGVIHAIDGVLLPPSMTEAMAEGDDMEMEATEEPEMEATEEVSAEIDEDAEMEGELGTIVDIAVATEELSTLVTAVTEAGYVETLSGEGPFTVFAPTNDAFEALPPGVLDMLISSPISLQSVLAYHVVEGAFTADDVIALDGEEVMTLLEQPVTVTVTDDGVMLNDTIMVTMTDILADNGVIHLIDGILLPEEAMAFMGGAPEGDMEATEETDMDMEATEEADMGDDMDMEATEEADMGESMVADMIGTVTSACLVTDQGGVNDGTFNELAANALNQAAEDFGIEISIIESNTPSDFEPNINTCLDGGSDAIITVGFLLADATLAAAEENSDVFFIGVDQFFMDHPENLVGLQFREDQSGFLAGALAALMTESNIIGGVYGEEIPPVIKFRNGFEQGARYVNPEIELLGAYIPSFVDGEAGAELAEALIGEGADVIFGAGGQTGSGGIIYAAGEGVLVIGVDQDEYFTTFGGGESPGAENIISSAIKRVDVGVYNMLAAVIDGSIPWEGGSLYILDATNGGVGLAGTNDADVPEDILEAVAAIEAMLAEGSLSTGVDAVSGALLEE